jgi:hypothetical protein
MFLSATEPAAGAGPGGVVLACWLLLRLLVGAAVTELEGVTASAARVWAILMLSKSLLDVASSASMLLGTGSPLTFGMLVRAPYLHLLSSRMVELCRIICPDVFDALHDCCNTHGDSSSAAA